MRQHPCQRLRRRACWPKQKPWPFVAPFVPGPSARNEFRSNPRKRAAWPSTPSAPPTWAFASAGQLPRLKRTTGKKNGRLPRLVRSALDATGSPLLVLGTPVAGAAAIEITPASARFKDLKNSSTIELLFACFASRLPNYLDDKILHPCSAFGPAIVVLATHAASSGRATIRKGLSFPL
jgi:hypothetical protein